MLKKFLLTFILFGLAASTITAQQTQSVSDTVMVLPFENTSGKTEFNWVGESFADSLSELLSGRWQQPVINGKPNTNNNLFGFSVVSNDERKIKQQQQNIPLTSIPSLAAALRLAGRMGVSKLIIGNFDITNAVIENKEIPTITAKVRLIDVKQGTFDYEKDNKGEPILNNGKKVFKEIVINKTLTDLQSLQGELAYQILLKQKVLTTSLSQVVTVANKVPSRAFEAYIKGLLTPENDLQTRENFFKNAMRIYAEDDATKGETYSDAALELGHFYQKQGKFPEAIDYFSRISPESGQYAEAAFYKTLIYWQLGNYEQALGTLRPLADDLKLTSVYNNLGAIAIQASRAEKKDKGKADALMLEGVNYLKKASESSTDESAARFNYGFALILNKNFGESAAQVRPFIVNNSRDAESYFLLAKALEKLSDPTAVEINNQAQRFFAENKTDPNRYARLAKDWETGKLDGIALRMDVPSRKDFVSVVLTKKQIVPAKAPLSEAESMLAQAQTFYKNGNDNDAMDVLRRILVSEPMNAQAYFLLGMIHLRRPDLDQAVSSLKTALFWNNNLIEARVALGKIYIQKGECSEAKTNAVAAAAIDAENQEVAGLQRLVERCSPK